MPLPTANEINVDDTLDEQSACKDYLGLTLDEVELRHREGNLSYQDHLMWMGPIAFRYYVTALIKFIRSDFANGYTDTINGFAGTLKFRLEWEPAELAPIADQLASVCAYIVENYPKFDVPEHIYGKLDERYQLLHQAFLKLSPTA